MIFADFNTKYLLLTDGENLQVIFAVPKDESPLPPDIEKEALELTPNSARAFIADGIPVQFWSKCLVPVQQINDSIQRIPKQVTKAPSGAAVSSMPLHEVAIPLDKAITAEHLALLAQVECINSVQLAKKSRLNGHRENAAFLLNDAAEYRRVFQAFRRAVDVMGGL
ncbi:hypothetical protein [Photobacterium chitinilyticum]|uniref:hypothetical protein n=1 Tax=Photobacterium chitinilyticum TaxID=2485123 RepID=UPI001F43347D|nr:hypothetical protein [Photobacterium chitinilyticum]